MNLSSRRQDGRGAEANDNEMYVIAFADGKEGNLPSLYMYVVLFVIHNYYDCMEQNGVLILGL